MAIRDVIEVGAQEAQARQRPGMASGQQDVRMRVIPLLRTWTVGREAARLFCRRRQDRFPLSIG